MVISNVKSSVCMQISVDEDKKMYLKTFTINNVI